ncbi:MAG: peptidase inhibitor family I36 protein [Egibacteraceae bacterium]
MIVVIGVTAAGAGVAQGQQGCSSVCLYDGTGYSGLLASFSSSTANVGNGVNDRASSVFNATSGSVRLFSDGNYGGASVCVNPNSGFGDLGTVGLNNAVSSLRFGC